MYIKRNYGFLMTFNWSKESFIYGTLYAGLVNIIYFFANDFGLKIIVPWEPISIIGIAVAFYLGFKNNSSYDRTWEARKIWGSIVNNSRTFGVAICAFVQFKDNNKVAQIKKELIYRHIAWLTALCYQLRLSRPWEHVENRVKGLYAPTVCEEYYHRLDEELLQFITKEELEEHKSKSNIATQILRKQSERLQELRDEEYYEDFRHIELHQCIMTFFNEQGASERIKNFPFPRQYASVALWISWVFAVLLPFGLLNAFLDFKSYWFWLNIPFSGLVIWVFFLMEKIGDYSENPFEGTYNDVPITSIARTIEIDLREMINDTNIPKPVEPIHGFLM